MTYMFRFSEDNLSDNSQSVSYDVTKNISFKSVPKKYRNKEIVTFSIENVNNKV